MVLELINMKNLVLVMDLVKNVKYFYCLSLHYNRANSYLFVNGEKIHKFKAKILRL